MVTHNGKQKSFHYSFYYQEDNLNECLVAGHTLDATMLAMLLKFRDHSVAFANDIKSLLP